MLTKILFFTNHNRDRLRNQDPFPRGVAYWSDGRFLYSGVSFGGSVKPVPLVSQDWNSLLSWVGSSFGDTDPIESEYRPGTAYKRITWPFAAGGNLERAVDSNARTQSFVALKILLTKMLEIFETVEPSVDISGTYGHKVRELLLLAAMEVEASWTAVLNANAYGPKDRLNTADYVKLLAPMLLDSYSFKLRSYPAFPSFAPFRGWSTAAPTQSLVWYDAYNKTKHNREENLNAATLERAIYAVGAAAILFYAQYGFMFNAQDDKSPFIRMIFDLEFDSGRYPTSYYLANVPPQGGDGTIAWDWELLDYPFAP